METKHNVRPTTAEIANLWNSYMNDTLSVCMLKYFLNKVEDTEIKEIIQYALHLAEQHVQKITNLFNSEDIPIPNGFTDQDVNINAPRLYSDPFLLNYIKQMSKIGLAAYGMALSLAARHDVVQFYSECLASITELNNKATNLALSKGLYIRAPYMPMPKSVEYIEQKGFLSDVFGEKRTLLAVEIAHLYGNTQTNALGKALIMGFAQVTPSKDVRNFMLTGKELAQKHINILSNLLVESDVPSPMSWNGDVMDSTTAPFSDKLMMYHVNVINAVGVGHYGTALAVSLRADLITTYLRLQAEGLKYGKDGLDIMITNHWMEQPPQHVNHEALSNLK
jgi:hypothetical protein